MKEKDFLEQFIKNFPDKEKTKNPFELCKYLDIKQRIEELEK